ncbi:FusB/FusC family EF-G-binding protein [Camelliibacillus cellulosilyticus]|uniref:FusB/FusC family EF-G-binding protein n=1 Tax=Camelliibacillus cellulosilyticus TaxID=2174486 RepID=A0ABV9GP19_9BACL
MENVNAVNTNVDAFIRNDQYNFIKVQTRDLVRGHKTANDTNVLNAFKLSSLEKVLSLFPDISSKQRTLLSKLMEIEENSEAERFLTELRPYVIPFQPVTEKAVKKLFPKVKKLKVPAFEKMDFKAYSFIGWDDVATGRKYILADSDGKLIAIQGTFKHSNKKGVCTICHGIEEVGLFMTRVKSGKETYKNRGNYICCDSEKCNQNLTNIAQLNDFIARLKK